MKNRSSTVEANEADGSAGSSENSKTAAAEAGVSTANFYKKRLRGEDATDSGPPTESGPKRFKRSVFESLTDTELGVIGVIPDDDEDECDSEVVGYKPTPNLPRQRSFLGEASKPAALTILPVTYSEVYHSPASPNQGSGEEYRFAIKKPSRPSCHEGHFSTLADELVLAVFKFLPHHTLAKCARVCRRWHRLALDEGLWKRVNLSGRHLVNGAVGTVLSRGALYVSLAKAEVCQPLFRSEPGLPLYRNGCTYRLLYLDLSMASIAVEDLAALLHGCRSLRKLSIEGCLVSNQVCRSIGLSTTLNTLNMSQCEGLTPAGVSSICQGCTGLSSLNIAWTQLDREGIAVLSQSLPAGSIRLNISGCRERLTDECVYQLVRRCPHLTELDLSDSTELTSAAVEHITSHLHDLQQLSMSRCYRVDAAAFMSLQGLHTLRDLNIFGMFTQPVLVHIQQSLKEVILNSSLFSTIARPTVGICRTSIWNERVREITW